MVNHKLGMICPQQFCQRIQGEEVERRWDDKSDIDLSSQIENVYWMNVWVAEAIDGRVAKSFLHHFIMCLQCIRPSLSEEPDGLFTQVGNKVF